MSFVDHYKITHRIVSSQQYSYSEVLEMAPFERDGFYAMLDDDAKKAQQEMSSKNSHYM